MCNIKSSYIARYVLSYVLLLISLCFMYLYLGPPGITYISPDMTYLEGTKASLVCNATNDVDAVNEVQIAWFYKNSTSLYQIVSSNNRVIHNLKNSTSGQVYSILLFDPINRTDEGVYICRASNHPQSSTESSTEVKIESK